MTLFFGAGVLVGLLLLPAWRLARYVREALRDDYLDVHSKERLEMLTKSGHL